MNIDRNTNVFYAECFDLFQAFLVLDIKMSVSYGTTFFFIAMNEGCSLSHLAKKTGLNLPTASRIVRALANQRQQGEPYRLVEIKICNDDRRKKEIFLTKKGHAFLKNLSA